MNNIAPPIRTAYFLRIPNVGDMVNSDIVTALTGRPVVHVAPSVKPHLLASGSVMASSMPSSYIWGTGVMHPDFGIGNPLAKKICAVRGKLSHSALRRAGIAVGDIPFGDPGYLAPGLLGIERKKNTQFRIGLACHYVDRGNPVLRRILQEHDVVDLNVHDYPVDFLRQMAGCDVVISSSLHGLIFAEAFGIPNLWLKAGEEIAGGDFKFNDWFSMSRRPQTSPYMLEAGDTGQSLAARASCHECEIDVQALKGAFPYSRLPVLEDAATPHIVPADICRKLPVPVFLISYNRGHMLKKCIAGLRALSTPVDIVVHDNGSTDPKTLEILAELEMDGVVVCRNQKINSADELNQVNRTVSAYFANWSEPTHYVVSDCDVDVSIADRNVLDVYAELLNRFRKVECVGPMLRIRDIPQTYPLFNSVMNSHIEQFWRHKPTFEQLSSGHVALLPELIDTTFALHRAGEPFRRLKKGLRVYDPFEARHLDWYQNDGNVLDKNFHTTSSQHVSHWDNVDCHRARISEQLKYSTYMYVKKDKRGKMNCCVANIGNEYVDILD